MGAETARVRRRVCAIAYATAGALAIGSGAAHAWNDTAHLAITMRAYDALPNDVRARLVAIVRQHPRFAADFAATRPHSLDGAAEADLDRWYFAYASVWPDRAREFANVADPAQRAALVARYDRPRWHFVNLPVFLADRDRNCVDETAAAGRESIADLDVVRALEHLVALWREPQTTAADRAIALAWIAHLVEDEHQPLHAATLYAQGLFPHGDRGGNAIELSDGTTLHRLWDESLGTRHQLGDLARIEARLPRVDGAAGAIDFAAWARESRAVADRDVYTDALRHALADATARARAGRVVVSLDAGYRAAMRAVALRQASLAATRLAAVLAMLDGAVRDGS